MFGRSKLWGKSRRCSQSCCFEVIKSSFPPVLTPIHRMGPERKKCEVFLFHKIARSAAHMSKRRWIYKWYSLQLHVILKLLLGYSGGRQLPITFRPKWYPFPQHRHTYEHMHVHWHGDGIVCKRYTTDAVRLSTRASKEVNVMCSMASEMNDSENCDRHE